MKNKYNPIEIQARVLNERRSRIRLSICFHAEKTTIKPTERPVNPMSAIDVLSDNGNNANKGIDITESPKPKVARVREPKKTNKTTKLISKISMIKGSLARKYPNYYCITKPFPTLC